MCPLLTSLMSKFNYNEIQCYYCIFCYTVYVRAVWRTTVFFFLFLFIFVFDLLCVQVFSASLSFDSINVIQSVNRDLLDAEVPIQNSVLFIFISKRPHRPSYLCHSIVMMVGILMKFALSVKKKIKHSLEK